MIMPTMKLSIEGAKRSFFDREKVVREIDRYTLKSLRHAGGYLRRVARNSIKKGKPGAVSSPGDPPRSHTGLLKDKIFFVAVKEAAQRPRVIVGPVKLNTPTNAPNILEYGGTTTIVRRDPKTKEVTRRKVRIEARPYMGPALEKAKSQIPSLFRRTVIRRA